MYHIKNDKRCINSVNKICRALEALLGETDLNNISVTDIQKKSGVGRSTFYRNFDTTSDVLTYMIESDLQHLAEKIENSTGKEILRISLNFFMEKKSLAYNIIHYGNTYLLINAYREFIHKNNLFKSTEKNILAKHCASLYAGAILSSVIVWYTNGQKENLDELCDITEKSIRIFAYGVLASEETKKPLNSLAEEKWLTMINSK